MKTVLAALAAGAVLGAPALAGAYPFHIAMSHRHHHGHHHHRHGDAPEEVAPAPASPPAPQGW